MIIIKNTEESDIVIKIARDGEDLPEEVTIASGSEFEVPEKDEKSILKWFLNAYKETSSDTAPESGAVAEDGATVSVKNDRGFDVDVTYKNADGEDTTATVADGEEIEVPTDQEESVAKQIADAVNPDDTGTGDGSAVAESTELNEARKELDRERAELAEQKAKLAEQVAESAYAQAVQEGKIVPAQKEAFMALATKANETVTVSEGNTKTITELLTNFIENAPAAHRLGEEVGAGSGSEREDDVTLTSEEESLVGGDITKDDLLETKKSLKGDK